MNYGFQLFQSGIKTQAVDFFTGHVHPRGLKKTAYLNIDDGQGRQKNAVGLNSRKSGR
jgi:hypothetical protein